MAGAVARRMLIGGAVIVSATIGAIAALVADHFERSSRPAVKR